MESEPKLSRLLEDQANGDDWLYRTALRAMAERARRMEAYIEMLERRGRQRKGVNVYRAGCDNCITIAETGAHFSMPEARELQTQLAKVLGSPPNCLHGYDVREVCEECRVMVDGPDA